MPDLTDEEWKIIGEAAWDPSFDGWAIVDEDFKFLYINPQWVEILGALPSEFLGKYFTDITPNSTVKTADIKNANLVKEGRIPGYLIHKEYNFSDGQRKKVILLVNRVPKDPHEPFRFFLSRILLDETEAETELDVQLKNPKQLSGWTEFVTKYGKLLIGLGLVLGGILMAFFGLG